MLLELEQVTKFFTRRNLDFPAVDHVDLAVDAGELVTIVGRSGNGKSTLLNLIAGLLEPDSGSIKIGGQNIAGLSDAEKSRMRNLEIGYVTQTSTLLPNLTVLDNVILPATIFPRDLPLAVSSDTAITTGESAAGAASTVSAANTPIATTAFSPASAEAFDSADSASKQVESDSRTQAQLVQEELRAAGLDDAELLEELAAEVEDAPNLVDPLTRRAMSLLEQLQVAHLAASYPKELSGGENRRVAIARALINQPQLILADEPTGDLDEESTRLVMRVLQAATKAGAAMLLVTHEKELLSYANRVYEITSGKLAYAALRQ